MCSDATNGEYEDLKAKSEAECPEEGDSTLSDSGCHSLSDVLEMLIRFDQQGYFMNASADAGCTPMCFSKMQEKVSSEQYPTWNSFVEDFESICQNAMKHNQKRSEVWNAACSLLRQGRRCLEQQSSKERTIIESVKSMQNGLSAQGEKSSPKVKQEQNQGPLPEPAVGLPAHAAKEERASSKSIVKSEIDKKREEGHRFFVDKTISPNSQLFVEKNLTETMTVDILELSPGDLARLESDKQATDCSSSFGDTQVSLTDDELDGQSCEVESDLRNGNGAMVLSDDIPSSNSMPRKKKAVNQEWKSYRQGIEWRCRWLELRVKELQPLAKRYNEMLATAKSTMKQELEKEESISARTSAIYNGYQHRALLRLQRRKEEENADSKMHMSKHPVFSRYEKKQQRSQEELANEENNKDDSYQILDFDDFHPDFDYGFGDDFLVEEDSIEQYLWHIEALQMHICRLKNQLTRGSISLRNALGQVKDISYPGGVSHQVCLYDTNTLTSSPNHLGAWSLLGGFKAKGGKSLSRKRSAEFDTDSLIMPDTVMANYIEPARHAFIEIPHWREVGDATVSARGGSSEEESDDETYKKRTVELQLPETHEQDVPGNKSESLAPSTCVEKEATVNTIDGASALNESGQNLSTSFGFVPRRKRRRRESRGNASVAKNIEPLLKASYEDSTDPCEPGGLVEDEDNHKASTSTG
ncbi:hypothetical protein GOP47_0006105 [Adiantum capillus-veneris]|uniref:Bromo domain-containing protein n=1 Tax=Adiantum capillus-veneris TaxID=13818 RepID=A0A9D4V2A3_ADICA|nr:hypothetical protein GOP47_0006105 [Adiantum capillus-veneris]